MSIFEADGSEGARDMQCWTSWYEALELLKIFHSEYFLFIYDGFKKPGVKQLILAEFTEMINFK